MSRNSIILDIRADIRAGKEPFSKIMDAVAQLRADESLCLIAPFEPVPLFALLQRRGFQHTARTTPSGDWEVRFTRESGGPPPETPAVISTSPAGNATGQSPEIIELDARGLEPPQPLVKILEALGTLPGRAELRAHTDRRPLHLYAQLEARGFSGESEEQSDGSFITHIRRR